jgi:hypothetical protein
VKRSRIPGTGKHDAGEAGVMERPVRRAGGRRRRRRSRTRMRGLPTEGPRAPAVKPGLSD